MNLVVCNHLQIGSDLPSGAADICEPEGGMTGKGSKVPRAISGYIDDNCTDNHRH